MKIVLDTHAHTLASGHAYNTIREMAAAIRAEKGNLKYDYFFPVSDPETVLLIDSWENQAAIDAHHASPMMATVIALRDKYDLHMTVERYLSDDYPADDVFIRH